MNILIVSTSDNRGGAAIAAYRLMKALKTSGTNVKMFVCEKLSDNSDVVTTGSKYLNKWNFYKERADIFLNNRFSKEHLFDISIANTGLSITDLPEFKSADIIHLHWINQGMLSLKEIGNIINSGKKVVWTMHDMWPFTGICHHAGECTNYEVSCGKCPFLDSHTYDDLSAKLFKKKKEIYSSGTIHFVGVSNWVAEKANNSPLTRGHSINVIPNVIDTAVFSAPEHNSKRSESVKTIIMGANRLDSPIKGFEYLKKALQLLVIDKKRIKQDSIKLILFGSIKNEKDFFRNIPVEFEYMGLLSDAEKVAALYRNADVVVVPSLYETFGQTIIEGMGCGIPAISFNNSGQNDIINHKQNGYLAHYKDVEDLAEGIYWTLFESDLQELSRNSRDKVVANYSQDIIAEKYIRLYSEL